VKGVSIAKIQDRKHDYILQALHCTLIFKGILLTTHGLVAETTVSATVKGFRLSYGQSVFGGCLGSSRDVNTIETKTFRGGRTSCTSLIRATPAYALQLVEIYDQ